MYLSIYKSKTNQTYHSNHLIEKRTRARTFRAISKKDYCMLISSDLHSQLNRLTRPAHPSAVGSSVRSSVSIPVYSQYGLLYSIPIHALSRLPANAIAKRRHGKIASVFLMDFGSDYNKPSHGCDRDGIHSHETDTNPPRVWEFEKPCLA